MGYKGKVCMAVGRVLIAVTNVYNRYTVLKICMQHTDESKCVYQCCTTSNHFGIEVGVFGAEASTPPAPLETLHGLVTTVVHCEGTCTTSRTR